MTRLLNVFAAFALAACASAELPVTVSSSHVVAALADSRRPAEDLERDAARHPAEVLVFAGVQRGQRVADFLPGGGYFTRVFAVAVGPEGRVFPVLRPPETVATWETTILEVASQYSNATPARTNFTEMRFPEPVDIVFTAQNYHDLHFPRYGFGAVADVNRAVFNALKPGGLYVIVDHRALTGSGEEGIRLHRIDPAQVRSEVEAAGFVFDGESDILRNPDDPKTASVFDPSIRGHSDQFIMRFRRPS